MFSNWSEYMQKNVKDLFVLLLKKIIVKIALGNFYSDESILLGKMGSFLSKEMQ